MEDENKRKTIKIGSILILLFLLIYVPSLIHWLFDKNIVTGMIRMGEIEDSINTDGYLARDEVVLKAPFEGKCIADVGEGEKVGARARVATILNDSSEKLYAELKDKDLEILKAQKSKTGNQNVFSQDIIKIEGEIGDRIRLIAAQSGSADFSKAKELKEDIDSMVRKKAAIFGRGSKADAYIINLKKERDQVQKKIENNTREIISENAGIISFTIDGLETLLNPAAVKNLTPGSLAGMKLTAKSSVNASRVEAERPFAKVIKDFEAYIIVELDENKGKNIRVDDFFQVRMNDIGKLIDSTVDYKSYLHQGKYIIALRIDKAISDTANLRKINIDLVKTRYEGLKVPLSGLRNINIKEKKAEIVIVKGNYASIRQVEIQGSNDEAAIIKSLNIDGDKGVGLYDTFVHDPGNIQEGQMVN